MYSGSTHTRAKPGRFALSTMTALGAGLLALPVLQAFATEATLPSVSLGAGMRTSFTSSSPDVGPSQQNFNLDSARLYINGSVMENIKFTFNTEYTSANNVEIMDAIARFEYSDHFNIWAGRFLPPVDRANLYGPYYANDWNPYADGVADFYPSVAVGRDNGVAYWGQFGMVKVSAGLFDGESLGGHAATDGAVGLLSAARVMVDFWDVEGGYYLNSTYYGEKDLLAVGVAAQNQHGTNSFSVDGLLEKKLAGAGTVTVETEYQKDDGLIQGATFDSSKGYYVLASYLFPQTIGIGKLQPLIKFSKKTYENSLASDSDVKTTELNLNYIIKSFNARISLFYLNQKSEPGSAATATDKTYGLGLQIQM